MHERRKEMAVDFKSIIGSKELDAISDKIAVTYVDHNLCSEKVLIGPNGKKQFSDCCGKTVRIDLPSYAELKLEALVKLENVLQNDRKVVKIFARPKKANVLLRAYRAEYSNTKTGITGGCFGVFVYVWNDGEFSPHAFLH